MVTSELVHSSSNYARVYSVMLTAHLDIPTKAISATCGTFAEGWPPRPISYGYGSFK